MIKNRRGIIMLYHHIGGFWIFEAFKITKKVDFGFKNITNVFN